MRTMITTGIIAVLLALLAIASGCEDSPVTAGKDDQMFVLALPPTVHVNSEDPTAPMTSSIVATIVNATGTPKQGLLVFFSCDGGELASGTQPVETDSNGNAYDTLTVLPGGPGNISVIATSTSLTETVTVTNGACDDNVAPTAVFTVGTLSPVENGTRSVELNGGGASGSTDTPPGVIKSYEWDCGTPTTVGTISTQTCVYPVGTLEKVFIAKLTVKDNGLGGTGPTYACQKASTVSHNVTIPAATTTPPTR